MSGNSFLNVPSRPSSAAETRLKYRLANPSAPPPPAQQNVLQQRFIRNSYRRARGSSASHVDAQRDADVNTDPKQKVGELLGLIARLLHGQEYKITIALVDHLANTRLADADICTRPVFKNQLAKFLHKQAPEVTDKVFDSIRQALTEEAEESRAKTESAIRSPRSSRSSASVGTCNFRIARQRRSVSMNTTSTTPRGTPPAREVGAGAAIAHSRALPRREEASDGERPSYRRSRISYDLSGFEVAAAIAPMPSRYEHDAGGVRKHHEARRKGQVDRLHDGVDSTLAPSRVPVHHEGVEDSHWASEDDREGYQSYGHDSSIGQTFRHTGVESMLSAEEEGQRHTRESSCG